MSYQGVLSAFEMGGCDDRLRILLFLKPTEERDANGRLRGYEKVERAVGEICGNVGKSQPAISHHLALLRHSGLVVGRRSGKNNFYSLTPAGVSLVNTAESLREALNDKGGDATAAPTRPAKVTAKPPEAESEVVVHAGSDEKGE